MANREQAKEAISAMLLTFPPKGDHNAVVTAYMAVVAEYDPAIIIEAAGRFARGKVVRKSKGFAPTGEELIDECDFRIERAKMRDSTDPQPSPLTVARTPYLQRLEAMREKQAHRERLAAGITFDRWLKLCARNEFPVGATFVAATGEVYR